MAEGEVEMGKFKVEKSSNGSGIIPEGMLIPEDAYYFDLIWIEELPPRNKNNASYRWTFKFAAIDGQTNYLLDKEEIDLSKFQVSALTPTIPTLNNKLGKFIKSLIQDLELDQEGDTIDLVRAKYRVKGFLERKESGGKIYHNVSKLIEGTARKGEGIGVFGIPNWMIDDVNEILEREGLPLLEKKDSEEDSTAPAKNPEVAKQEEIESAVATEEIKTTSKTKKKDTPW